MATYTQTKPGGPEVQATKPCIPEWARQVQDVLKESGAQPLASLARKVPDTSTNEVAMAVGWLAHAGAIQLSRREGLLMIALQELNDASGTQGTR